MKKRTLLGILSCMLSVSVIACQNTETDTQKSETMNETMTDTQESETMNETISERAPALMEADLVTKNLLCLKNGDTKSLVGLSFGDEFDYDGYVVSGWSGDRTFYRRKETEYGSEDFIFGGKRNGFSGLQQTWEGNFFGITLGEDTLETLTDVLGASDTLEEKTVSGEVETWAVWHFENATLSARIIDNKIRTMEYLADGTIADAKERAESETDFGKDRMTGNGHVETIYNWCDYDKDSTETYARYHPHDEDYDLANIDSFIHNYLSTQGIDQQVPDGISYNQNGDRFVEYYVNTEKKQYCFVVHLWGDYWVDYDAGISKYQDAIYCTTYTRNEDDKVGYLIWEQDNEKNTGYERMYDKWGNKMAEVSYTYIPEMPFPLIEHAWNLEAGFLPTSLIRNQKTWFYKDLAQFDESGKFISYAGEATTMKAGGAYLYYPCRTIYDTDGRIKAIQEELQEEDIERDYGWWDDSIDYSGQLALDYGADGTIQSVDYHRSSYTHGTTDSSGYIEYDKKGRMIYNDYYITHGSDSGIYLYEGDSTMPWCVFNWCSFLPGFENVWLYLPY